MHVAHLEAPGSKNATVSPTGRMYMSGAMKFSMNGPPPGAGRPLPERDICWTSTRPPGFTERRSTSAYVG